MINAATASPSENSQPVMPVDQAMKNNFQPTTSASTTNSETNPGAGSNTNPASPPPKPNQKKKLPLKMILGGILLVLLVVGSGVGLYLSQQTQDIRQDASVGLTGTEVPPGQEGSSTQAETCNYSCSGGHPSTPQLSGSNCGNPRAMDICRGKGYVGSPDGKYYNCQLCRLSNAARDKLSESEKAKRQAQNWYACPGEETDADASGCDFSCLCGNADQNTCYEKGPSHDAGVFNGNFNCKNTQVDVILNGAHKWNCTSTDNKDWSQCAPPPPPTPASCQSITLNPSGTVTDQTVSYTVTGTAGTTKAEFCFHSKDVVVTGADAWSKGWHCLQPTKSTTNANLYTGTFKYADIRSAIVAINPAYGANIDAYGYRYATRIYTSENVYCTGNGVWSDGGTHHGSTTCTYNNACGGFITPKILISGPSCKSLAVTGGTVVSGVRQVSSGTTKLTFDLTGEFPGGTIAGDQICFYPNYLGNKNDWSLGWYCLPSNSSVAPNPYHVEKTYNEIRAGIRARDPNSAKITNAQIDADGFRYAGNVHAPKDTFCDGGSNWTGIGNTLYTACTYNSACAGNVKLIKLACFGQGCTEDYHCGDGLICETANNGNNYCMKADTGIMTNCKANPTQANCCGSVPEKKACGVVGCVDSSSCQTGLTCVTATNGNKYCSKSTDYNKTACAANPSNATCCQDEKIYQCNSDCTPGATGNAQCSGSLGAGYSCVSGKCRLTANPTSTTCQPPQIACGVSGCVTDANCVSGLKCVQAGNGQKYCAKNTEYNLASCAENPSNATCCQDEKVIQCNSDCTSGAAGNAECSAALGAGYSCIANKCRLTENPTSTTCTPLTPIACNGACTPGATGDAQCQKTNPKHFCAPQTGSPNTGKCRHTEWPESLTCKKPDPVCVGITMSPTTPQINSEVTFTCSLVTGVDNYQFRITEPGATTPISLAVFNKNISVPYKVEKPGSFKAECRLCPTTTGGETTCLAWPQ